MTVQFFNTVLLFNVKPADAKINSMLNFDFVFYPFKLIKKKKVGKVPTAHRQSLNNVLQTDGKWHSHKPIFILKNLICVHYIDYQL